MNTEVHKSTCPNCQEPSNKNQKFCSKCGQKKIEGIPSLKEILEDFSSMLFNIDAKLYQTLKVSFIPARLTLDYFQGIRGRYYQPFRLFFISSLLFFWLLSLTDFAESFNINFEGNNIEKTSHNIPLINVLDSLEHDIVMSSEQPLIACKVFDSLQANLAIDNQDSIRISIFSDDVVKVSEYDFMKLTSDEIIKKYEISTLSNKIFIKQFQKVRDDRKNFAWFITSNLIWVLILLLPIFALILMLLYYNKRKFFIEHLIFLFHNHAIIFLISALTLLISIIFDSYIFVFIGIVLVIIFVLKAIKNYYKESWMLSIIKFVFGSLIYYALGCIIFVFNMLISFTFY